MRIRGVLISVSVVAGLWIAKAGEVSILALRDMSDVEVKSAGIVVPREITFHVKALGGGGSGEGMFSRGGRMFAYGWIINADNRSLVWRMTADNTSQAHDDRSFDGEVTLGPGNYEVYFTAYAFVSHTFFSHWETNVDHRQNPLFGKGGKGHKGFFSFFTDLWADDITKEWGKRSKNWGIELLSDESLASSVKSFSAPKEMANVVLKATGLADGALVRQGFSLTKPLSLRVYALGEGESGDDLADYGWIVDTRTRKRVWEMDSRDVSPAGGAEKNVEFTGDVRLEKGDYALYYITDDSHSMADWNQAPPDDPLNYGITITVGDPKDVKIVKPYTYEEDKNLIVAITRVGNNENRTSGFTLKSDCAVRVYAFGERGNSRAQMADYGYIMDAKTRQKVWTMDVDRTSHGGGASKNRFVDEVIPLEKGSYIVAYNTDDSHAYGDWNADPPFDQDHYGISVMGMCDKFSAAMVAKYVE